MTLTVEQQELADELLQQARSQAVHPEDSGSVWQVLHQTLLSPQIPFAVHQHCYDVVYAQERDIKPSWFPSATAEHTNIQQMMQQRGFSSYTEFYQWSIQHKNEFWMQSQQAIGVQWSKEPSEAMTGPPSDPDYEHCRT